VSRTLVAGALALLAAAIAAITPSWAGHRSSAGTTPPPRVDRDGNGIFDDLETQLAQKKPDERLPVIVVVRARASLDRIRGLERAVGGFETGRRFSIIDGFSALMTRRQIEALARNPVVRQIEENSIVHASNDTAQDAFGVTQARIDAPTLDGDADGNPGSYSKNDLVAAVIDTGIATGHQDLDEGKVIAFKDFVNGGATPYDDEGHGTHVSGTLAGDGDARSDKLHKGVAPAAALVGVKVLDRTGSGRTDDVIAGIEWAVQNKSLYGIEAANLSLGIEGCSAGTDASSLAVNNAVTAGLVVAVAAGNEGPGTCTIGSPGAAAQALTVGAMADFGSNGFYQADFSSRGPTADGRIKPDVSGPGVNITSALAGSTNGYVAFDGTSMATPFVAGVALLMLDANRALTPQQLKDKVTATARDWGRGGDNKTTGSIGPDIDYGAGRLDGYAAIRSAGAAIDNPPSMPAHEFAEGTLPGTGSQVDYPLEVSDTRFPIAATLIIPAISGGTSRNPDFDLYLLDPNGNELARGFTYNRQEELGYKPTVSGTYTVRVRSFKGSGGYFVDVSAGLKPPVAYPQPADARRVRVSLVPALKQCTAPNTSHGSPLDKPACSPPQQTSDHLTVPSGSSSQARGSALIRVICHPDPPGTFDGCGPSGDQADVSLSVTAADVRNKNDRSDYTGELEAVLDIRITDRDNGPLRSDSATVSDFRFPVAVPCAATGDESVGSTCSVTTRVDAIMPGAVREGNDAVWALGQIKVYDGGADGIASTAGNTLFLDQGIFVP
jgi:serine protease AprX